MSFIRPFGCPDAEGCHPDEQVLIGEGEPGRMRQFACRRCTRAVKACPGSEGVSANWTAEEVEKLTFFQWLFEQQGVAVGEEEPAPRRRKKRPATPRVRDSIGPLP